MALKVKAKEKLQKIGKYADTYRYVMMPEIYSALNQEKVIREAALRSGVSQGVMQACWDAAGEVIKAWATEGHSVALPGLGTMRFGLRAKSCATVNDVKTSLIKTRRIIFTPTGELKDELKNTAIQITCYDRNGEEVKRVTSSDPAVIEDPEQDNGNGNENGNENENGNDNGNEHGGGSGSETPSVSAPSFAGNTQFEESTQVTITGPSGSEIHYTVDGSTPTAESPVYSEALTFTETTTLKAIAIKDGVSSSVTSRTYTKGTNAGGSGDEGDTN